VKYKNKIENMLKKYNGIITASQITDAGIPRYYLSIMLKNHELTKADRGVYVQPEVWEDELFILQYKYKRGIFSHETALDIHGLTDRMPGHYVMTFPANYNTTKLKQKIIKIKKSKLKIYELGIVEALTACGNKVKVYDVERTLCDICRGKKEFDIQLVNEALKNYLKNRKPDIYKLMKYAKILRVKNKIQKYMEILL